MGRGIDWTAEDVAQLRQWLNNHRKSRDMRWIGPDWSMDSFKTKLQQLCRGAPEESRPLKKRRTTEVLAEIEPAVNEALRQTLSVRRRQR